MIKLSVLGVPWGSRNECFFEEMSDKMAPLLLTLNPDFYTGPFKVLYAFLYILRVFDRVIGGS